MADKIQLARQELARRELARRSDGTATVEQPEQESSLREAYREGLGQAAHGVSQIAFGIPEFVAQKISPRFKEAVFPEPRTPEGKIFRTGTDITSLFAGGAAKLGTKTLTAGLKGGFKELAKKGLKEKIARSAASGAVYGATQLDPESTVGGQASKATGGAVGGAVIGAAIPLIGNIPKAIKRATKGEAAFGDMVMKAFRDKKIEAIKRWEKDVAELIKKNPGKTSGEHLIDIMKETQATAGYDQKLNAAVNADEQLRKLVNNPDLARNMPMEEVQTLVTKLNSKVQGKYGQNFYELKDFVHRLKEAQLKAFPEMAPVKEAYAEIAEPYRLIRAKIKEGSILKNLANKFGDAQLNRRAEKLMTSDLKAEVDSYRRTKKLLKTIGFAGKTAGTGLAIGAGYKLIDQD